MQFDGCLLEVVCDSARCFCEHLAFCALEYDSTNWMTVQIHVEISQTQNVAGLENLAETPKSEPMTSQKDFARRAPSRLITLFAAIFILFYARAQESPSDSDGNKAATRSHSQETQDTATNII